MCFDIFKFHTLCGFWTQRINLVRRSLVEGNSIKKFSKLMFNFPMNCFVWYQIVRVRWIPTCYIMWMSRRWVYTNSVISIQLNNFAVVKWLQIINTQISTYTLLQKWNDHFPWKSQNLTIIHLFVVNVMHPLFSPCLTRLLFEWTNISESPCLQWVTTPHWNLVGNLDTTNNPIHLSRSLRSCTPTSDHIHVIEKFKFMFH